MDFAPLRVVGSIVSCFADRAPVPMRGRNAANGGKRMKTPEIRGENVEPMLETKFLRVFDLRYAEGKHYYDATRRQAGELAAVKDDEAFRNVLPDAVTCVVILNPPVCSLFVITNPSSALPVVVRP